MLNHTAIYEETTTKILRVHQKNETVKLSKQFVEFYENLTWPNGDNEIDFSNKRIP